MRGRRQRRGLRRSPPGEPPLPPAQQQKEEKDHREAPRPLLPRVLPEAMLPWKRHKAELSSPGPPSPPASPGPSSSSSSTGGSGSGGGGAGAAVLLRRLFSSSRRRAGQRRRRSFRVSREAPCVPALYLGHAATLQAKGEGCTEAPVGRLWARSQGGRLGVRMRLSVGPQGLRLAPAREGGGGGGGGGGETPPAPSPSSGDPPAPPPGTQLYLLHRVTHCAADARLPRLLSWVYRHEARHKAVLLRCHAALLPKAAQAQALALLLLQTSAAALADFRRLKRRSDARHQRQRLLLLRGGAPPPQHHQHPPGEGEEQNPTLTPLAKATASALGYKPPAGRGRGAPRLGPIPEDPRGEEEEEEEEEEGDRGGTPTPTRDKRLGRLLRGLGALGLGNSSSPAQPDTG